MKNYPNQAVELRRIRRTLEVIAELRSSGVNVNDNDTLGYSLARNDAYTFRALQAGPSGLEDRIAQERTKPLGNQGAQTNAREMRRTLRGLGWLTTTGDVTEDGLDFLASEPDSVEERERLALALWNLPVADSDGANSSHPVRVMLRLLADQASHSRRGLELALEAVDDSVAEASRVLALYRLADQDRRALFNAAGISDTQIANAKKVFPALAVAAGLVTAAGQLYDLAPLGWEFLGLSRTQTRSPTLGPRRMLRTVTPETIAAALSGLMGRTLSEAEQRAARRRLAQRARAHNVGVRQLAGLFTGEGELAEGSVDLLWMPADHSLPLALVEFKTIDGDAEQQIRHAVGQLLFYRHFDVEPLHPGRVVTPLVATDSDVPSELADYLDRLEIGLIVLDGGVATARNTVASQLPDYLLTQ